MERVSFVEIIVRLELDQTAKPADVMNAGRRAVASLRAQLDLTFGPRLLGALLLEEIGSVFDDWHWNRRLDTVQLAAETQVPEEVVPGQRFAEIFSAAASQHLAKDRQQQRRLALASHWYWLAEGEEDPVNRFIQHWIVVEILEMETTNIKPVVQRLADLFPLVGNSVWQDRVGRLFGLRSNLVHGKQMEVDAQQSQLIGLIAKVLLGSKLTGTIPAAEGTRLMAIVNP